MKSQVTKAKILSFGCLEQDPWQRFSCPLNGRDFPSLGCPGTEVRINGDRINGLVILLLINGIYWLYIPLILTIYYLPGSSKHFMIHSGSLLKESTFHSNSLQTLVFPVGGWNPIFFLFCSPPIITQQKKTLGPQKKKNNSYFPWNSGCLIWILISWLMK